MRARICVAAVMLVACAKDPAEGAEPLDDAAGQVEAAGDEDPAARDPALAEAYEALAHSEKIERSPVAGAESEPTIVADDEQRLVVGRDTRKRVPDTSVPPYSSAVLLQVRFPGEPAGSWYTCSGTLIAADAVLTAAHCVYKHALGGLAQHVIVVPGSYVDARGVQQPLSAVGLAVSGTDQLYVPPEYDDSAGYDRTLFAHDYAVIRTNTRLGDKAGTRPVAVANTKPGDFATMIAYHGDLCARAGEACGSRTARNQFVSSDSVRKVEDGWMRHYIDMTPGASGAGISSGSAARAPIFAVNIAENALEGFNAALLITPQVYQDLEYWAGL
jgi:V8-like Glu-specific endopeptidase